jgi:hypothetical protein
MSQINQPFLVMKNLELSITANTPKGKAFVYSKGGYTAINCQSYLVFKYKGAFQEVYVKEDHPEVWFTHHHLYRLTKAFKYFARELEKDDDLPEGKSEIYYIDPDSGMLGVFAEQAKLRMVIQAANNLSIAIEYGVHYNEKTNSQNAGIIVYIQTKDFPVFMPIEYVSAIATFLNSMNLLQLTQNMIAIEICNKKSKTSANQSHVKEEDV